MTPPRAVAISPDGQTIAWTLASDMEQREGSSLHLTAIGASNAASRVITPPGPAGCTVEDPVWAPDGETLAFLSTCVAAEEAQPAGQEQIFLWSKETGTARQLTHLKGELQQLAWSPDAKAIGFLFVENATRSAGALDAMKPWSGVIGEDGVEVQGIYVVNADNGQGSMQTAPNQHVYEFAWSPSTASPALAWIGAPAPGENNWWVAKLYAQWMGMRLPCIEGTHSCTDGGPPSPVQVIVDPVSVSGPLHGLQIAVPRWSPDGTHIAFIGGLMSDQGSTGGDVYVAEVKRDRGPATPVNITPAIDGTPTFVDWLSDHSVGFVENRRGHTLLNAVNMNTKAIVPGAPSDLGEVTLAGGTIQDAISVSGRLSGSKDRVAAFVQSSFDAAPEIWTFGPGGDRQLTHLNDGLKPSTRTESVEWANGPFHIQGWLTFPVNYDPHTRYPLVVQVHGGPSSSVTSLWDRAGHWPNRGYFEFQPNPRGSFGQGEAFVEANRKDFGYGDLQDILAGLDTLEARYPIDKDREGLTGWSYGGFMTMFAVTQTHRFKAAIAGAGVSDWLSYYGENSIDQWMTPFFGTSVYDDPAVYAKSSAITFIKNVKTPTLVIVGDRDGECPAPQSFEFWHALRDLGVKTQLVVYPNEGHHFRDPEHIRDRDEREAKWFADNMPARGRPATASGASASR